MKSIHRLLRGAVHYFLTAEGSTRPLAILRIGIVLLLWSRFANDLVLSRLSHPLWVLTSVLFFSFTPLLLIGLWTRFAAVGTAVVAALLYWGIGHGLGHEPYRHHHVWLLLSVTLLLPLGPSARSYSVDRWRALKRFAAPPERGALFAQRLMCLQVSAVYFFGAIDKTTFAYLSGARLEHLMLAYYGQFFRAELPSFGAITAAMAISTVALEYALAFGLYVRRLQPALVVAGLVFHLVIYATLPVFTFSATICLLYLAYLDPDGVHRAIERLAGRDVVSVVPEEAAVSQSSDCESNRLAG